jgi:hypothetical protein
MSLFCGQNEISLLPLKLWGQDLGFDVPYVGVALSLKKSVDSVDIHMVKYKLLETLTCGTSKSSS